jgi:hypothetical protein
VYLDNDTFLQDLISYKRAVEAWKAHLRKHPRSRRPKPTVPDAIALAVMALARRLAASRKFAGYTYVEDLIADAVYICIRYIDRFDPAQSSNPLGYFNLACRNAFLQRIDKEKKQSEIKVLALHAVIRAESRNRNGGARHHVGGLEAD